MVANYSPKNGVDQDYKEFEPCMKPDPEVDRLMKDSGYQNRHAQALVNGNK